MIFKRHYQKIGYSVMLICMVAGLFMVLNRESRKYQMQLPALIKASDSLTLRKRSLLTDFTQMLKIGGVLYQMTGQDSLSTSDSLRLRQIEATLNSKIR